MQFFHSFGGGAKGTGGCRTEAQFPQGSPLGSGLLTRGFLSFVCRTVTKLQIAVSSQVHLGFSEAD